ncbi:MAG: response regulator transcription factor [Catalinimonas sp.]
MKQTPYTVVLVDDHQLMIDGLQQMLADHAFLRVMTAFTDPREALQKVPILRPDILVTDLDMPHLTGPVLIKRLRPELPELRTVILSMHVDQTTVRHLMTMGIDGYLLKNENREDFLHGLETVAVGKRYFSSRVTEVLADRGRELTPTHHLKAQSLTPRELDVLRLVTEGYATREIAEQLNVAPATVETHRKALLRKLDVTNVAGLVRVALREGIV